MACTLLTIQVQVLKRQLFRLFPLYFSCKAALLPIAPSFFPWYPLHPPCYCLTSLQEPPPHGDPPELTSARAETQWSREVWGDRSQCGAWCYTAQAVLSHETKYTAEGWDEDFSYPPTFSPLLSQVFLFPVSFISTRTKSGNWSRLKKGGRPGVGGRGQDWQMFL